MNQKNSLGLNYCFLDLDDPLELFKSWMAEAEKKEIRDPTASSLATANNAGQPDVRMVLLKGLSSRGFVFYTNLNSSKSRDLKENPKAAMCFHWKSFNRQVRILGSVTQVDDREADLYFNSRPYESRISAWASDQSNTMKERSELLKKIENFKKKYIDESIKNGAIAIITNFYFKNIKLPQFLVENISASDTTSIGTYFLLVKLDFLSIQNQIPRSMMVMIIRISQVAPNVVPSTSIGDVSSRTV